MSLARIDRRSDVYVFENADGDYECLWIGHRFTGTAAEMIDHLLMHRYEGGARVPESTLAALRELAGVTAP